MVYKKPNNEDFITHKLTVILDNTGNKGWAYKSKSKVMMYDETTKKKLSPYQFQQWIDSPHIVEMIDKGANLKIATQDYEDNPNKYDNGKKRKVIFYFSALKNQPPKPIDGLRPVGQTMPQYKQIQMTEAQPAAPDHALPVEKMSDMDDEIPF